MYSLFGQYEDFAEYLKTQELSDEEFKNRIQVAIQFLENVRNNNNEWVIYE